MTGLTAADALVRSVVPVDMYSRSHPAGPDRPEFYAVYTEPEFWDGAFLGVVPGPATARFPRRVFADLLPRYNPPPVEPETPLDAVCRMIEAEGVEAVPVVGGRGECVGVVTRASLSDAVLRSEVQRARERAASHDQLAEQFRAAREQTARLEEELRRARRSEEVGRLALGVAHDLNNLLTVIVGGCDVLLGRSDLTAEVRATVEEVRQAGESASALTRQLVEFGRGPAVTPPPAGPSAASRPTDLNAVITEATGLLRRLVGKGVELALELAPNLRPVAVDPGQLGRVLLNLATNARDAMPRGGRLTVRTANVRIWESGDAEPVTSRLREYTLLTVADTGCGMDRPTLERVFEPFFTTKGLGMGTGLGLTVVRDIVGRSGGYVTVRSEVGRGTTFSLYFPQSAPPVPPGDPSPARPIPEQLPAGTETVLLIEDDDGVRSLATQILRSCGYTVLEAAKEADAVRTATEHPGPVHLIVADVQLPGMGGPRLVEHLCSARPEASALLTSGDDAPPPAGSDGRAFLPKPFTPRELATLVRELLDRGQPRK